MQATAFALRRAALVPRRLGSRGVLSIIKTRSASAAADSEAALVERLKQGDEQAFMAVVERYHAALVRLAQSFVPSRAVAEEVAQETWLAVLQGIGRFEGRSSLKTWLFRILANRAKTRGEREARCLPFSCAARPSDDDD